MTERASGNGSINVGSAAVLVHDVPDGVWAHTLAESVKE
jgi:hypothetical protein